MGDLRTNEEVAAPLSCGGRGPCCHIGYSHRHCEHCDVVIDTRPAGWYWPIAPYIAPYVAPSNPWYQPWWNAGGGWHTTSIMTIPSGTTSTFSLSNGTDLAANADGHLCLTGN